MGWDLCRRLGRVIVWTTVVCMWLMWLCTYAAQVNPLGNPIIKETANDKPKEE